MLLRSLKKQLNVILCKRKHKLRSNLCGSNSSLLSLANFCSVKKGDTPDINPRFNPINIQMLSSGLHRQIFGPNVDSSVDQVTLEKIISHLKEHGLWEAKTNLLPEINFEVPPLHDSDVVKHFHAIGTELSSDYKRLLNELIDCELPPMPKSWKFVSGWSQYSNDGTVRQVAYPEEDAMVFDVEVCMQEGNYPTLATAVSAKHWYCWCSKKLAESHFSLTKSPSLSDLIPLESTVEQMHPLEGGTSRLVVGHNVAFDRTFVKEQYFLEQTKTAFLDTMSLHMCVSGLTGTQRAMSIASKKNESQNGTNSFPDISMGWSYISSLNNLADVYSLYCDGSVLEKAEREIFVSGSLNDVIDNFQELVSYCARDTLATYKILKEITPIFFERFPHPVTFFGILEMSSAYLPVNQNWERYLNESQSTYEDLQKELKLSLVHLANDACSLLHNNLYKKDPWLWDLDWTTQNLRFRKEQTQKSKKKKRKSKKVKEEVVEEKIEPLLDDVEYVEEAHVSSTPSQPQDPTLKHIYDTAQYLRKVRPFLPGYPLWYRSLCNREDTNTETWEPGPNLISTQMRCVPKLMRLTWDGFPLHYDAKHGWGYLVLNVADFDIIADQDFPLRSYMSLYSTNDQKSSNHNCSTDNLSMISDPKDEGFEESKLWKAILGDRHKSEKSQDEVSEHYGNGPFDIGISGCLFYRLPHKDGPHKRVGNPLSKDFLPKVEDGTLRTWGKGQADRALLLSKMLSYWKNAHGRIMSQMVVWLNQTELDNTVVSNENYDQSNSYGAILPRLIPAGTVTRRAVEPTWLTASNAYEDRVGSELKCMVQSPPGYHFVGADVDSQELWIAAIFGDSQFAKVHGCTAFGWMTLQGKKSASTDMHSKTANSIGISRHQAKILNYSRIYGAGKSFTQRLIMQFNHRLTPEEAKQKIKKIYLETKGSRRVLKSDETVDANICDWLPMTQKRIWMGGSESHMFNKLEEIALSSKPRTPVLGCRISRALEPTAVDKNFMTSRVNWVVQSSAVDFLHLMLTCMRWLFNEYDIKGRFSISIHDEVRYLVKSEDRYRAALALQITNLLTRSYLTSKLDMKDLPQSVAFFSAVDIDTVMRKEVDMDSVTPSNPHGLEKGYGIAKGEALDIAKILRKTHGGSLHKKEKI